MLFFPSLNKLFVIMKLDQILDMLGNDTRREILQLLSEGPCYVSQVSQELNVGQKAIIEHLKLMHHAGILETRDKKIEKGRPRKYYDISQEVILEVKIGHRLFDISDISPVFDNELLKTFPKLEHITAKLEMLSHLTEKDRMVELESIYKQLEDERDDLDTAKRIVEYFLGQVNREIQSQKLEKELSDIGF